MKKILFALGISLQVGLSGATCLNLDVINRDTGETLQKWRHHGQLYVAGQPGQKYGIRINNCGDVDELAVVSVDGINVVSGKTASSNQNGYMLSPGATSDINGWRKNMNEVATFNFTAKSNSYASKTGRESNVGVIGAAVFERMVRPPVPAPMIEMDKAMSAPFSAGVSRNSLAAEQKIGTGHGEREYDQAYQTSFERATQNPSLIIAIRYDTYDNLVRKGIIPRHHRHSIEPTPFPGDNGFVPDPPLE
jgi:hypothetical protein